MLEHVTSVLAFPEGGLECSCSRVEENGVCAESLSYSTMPTRQEISPIKGEQQSGCKQQPEVAVQFPDFGLRPFEVCLGLGRHLSMLPASRQ